MTAYAVRCYAAVTGGYLKRRYGELLNADSLRSADRHSDFPKIVRVEGDEWDISTCERFAAILEEALKYPCVILDMSAVRYIDSSCLRELTVMYQKRVLLRGYDPARIVIANSSVRRIFAIVRFDMIWPLFDSVDAALQDAGAQPASS